MWGVCTCMCVCVFMGIVSGCLMNEHGEQKREERLLTTVVFSSLFNLKKSILISVLSFYVVHVGKHF